MDSTEHFEIQPSDAATPLRFKGLILHNAIQFWSKDCKGTCVLYVRYSGPGSARQDRTSTDVGLQSLYKKAAVERSQRMNAISKYTR